MTMKTSKRVTIIGAGLVGSLLARLLARRGHEVTVLEKRPDPTLGELTGGRSTHLVISARGWRAIDAIDARAVVEPRTLPLFGRRVHQRDSTLQFHPYGEQRQSISAIHRSVLSRCLLSLCARTPGITLHFEKRCSQVEPATGRIVLDDLRNGQRSELVADYIFAADGAFSTVRRQLLRRSRLDFTQAYEPFGYKELHLTVEQARSLEPDAMHAWPRGEVSLFAFPNPDGTFTATLLAPFDGPRGFSSLSTTEDVSSLFRRAFSDVPLGDLAAQVLETPSSSLLSVRCSPWTFGGRLALIGDAAHAMVPFLGQGMNAGFEDCTALAGLLDAFDEDFGRALAEFEARRRPQSDAVTTLSTRAFKELTEGLADPTFQVRQKVEHKLRELAPDRFVPPYELIAFTHVPYAELLEKIDAQNAIVNELLKTPGIEANWDSSDVEQRILDLTRVERSAEHAQITSRPTLVSFMLCPFVQRAAIVLEEKRVEHDVRYVDLASAPDWFTELSPLRRVPVLVMDGRVIFESAVISEFLDEVYPGRLHPRDVFLRAENRAWIEFGTECTFDAHRVAVQPSETEFLEAREALRRKLDRLEPAILGAPFFNGPAFSLVDSAFAPMLLRLEYLEASGVGVFDPHRHPKLVAWKEHLIRRDSVIRATPPGLRQHYCEFIESKGSYVARLVGERREKLPLDSSKLTKAGGRDVGRRIDEQTN
jgi:kynurenine 3-monooxygenase